MTQREGLYVLFRPVLTRPVLSVLLCTSCSDLTLPARPVLTRPLLSLQAFLEMNSEEAAQNMVSYYSTVMPIIRHHPVYVQFSNHKELKTDNSPNQEVPLASVSSCWSC